MNAIVVGAGLSGLACALYLRNGGIRPLVVESAARIGGRVQTDVVRGFRLDRGFQVFLSAYPEASRLLDLHELDLCAFEPGALVRVDGALHRLSDPWRRPTDLISTLRAPVGDLSDKLRMARLRLRVRRGTVAELFRRPETTTVTALQQEGFSIEMIDRFFRPFLGGVFLERDLATSSRMFEFVFRMFAEGEATLPRKGMGAIAEQLGRRLGQELIRTEAAVQSLNGNGVTLASGERIPADAVVVATDGTAAARLIPGLAEPRTRSVVCLYFAAERPPLEEPVLILNGNGVGPINNLCVPSQVAPSYAPEGAALISVTVLEDCAVSENDLQGAVWSQLRHWFGPQVSGWRHLRTYRIQRALPAQLPPLPQAESQAARVRPRLYVCGDHRAPASIEGAFMSARRVAAAVIENLS